jgi:hypothetical protein
MHIHEIETNRADAIEAGLAGARPLEGRFILEEWAPSRYHFLPVLVTGTASLLLRGCIENWERLLARYAHRRL